MQPLQKKGSFKSAQIKGVTVEVTLSSCVSPINEQLNVVVERGAKERKMFVVSGPIGRGRTGIFGGRGTRHNSHVLADRFETKRNN